MLNHDIDITRDWISNKIESIIYLLDMIYFIIKSITLYKIFINSFGKGFGLVSFLHI